MREAGPNISCLEPIAKAIHRAAIGLMMVALVVGLYPRVATAGVIVEQRVTKGAAGGRSLVTNRTLMVQGDKEKFVINDRQSIVIDVDSGAVTEIDYGHKVFRQLPFKRVMGTFLDPTRLLYSQFKTTGKGRKVLGLKCQDYDGANYRGALMTAVTACFSSKAAGSEDFSHFIKSLLKRLGHRAQGVSIPDGLPLIIESTERANPSFTFPDVPEKEMLQFKSRIAKIPPQVTREEVTKLASEKLAAAVFTPPAGFIRRGPPLD